MLSLVFRLLLPLFFALALLELMDWFMWDFLSYAEGCQIAHLCNEWINLNGRAELSLLSSGLAAARRK